MRRFNAVLFALLMATMSLAGCFGGDDNDDSEEEPVETLDDWMVYSVDSGPMALLTIPIKAIKQVC